MHAKEHPRLLIKNAPLGPGGPSSEDENLKAVGGESTNRGENSFSVLDRSFPGLHGIEEEGKANTEPDNEKSELDLRFGEELRRNAV